MAFRASDPDYLLMGSDGGLYESFDLAQNWRFMANLPLTQFYKVAVDDAEPFYNIYGGTQDNSTEGGPSRTDNVHGIQNSDWRVVLDWDGHQPATEPGNPDILYAERQQGFLSRVDMTTGEVVHIQPQPEQGEEGERFNWDAPILVSPHQPTRIYFASQRVWRSRRPRRLLARDLRRSDPQRGEASRCRSCGGTQSWDNAWDISAMSNYNTITSLAESPLQEGLMWAGTDDGLLQVTMDGGESWRSIEVGSLPGVPDTAFVNDVKASLYDAETVYVALDNHKYGDYDPYLLMSTNAGRSWKSIRGDLPDRTIVWRVVQDHVREELLFAGTEFGIYFTVDGGERWVELEGGMPTISIRDLAIQRRENDLVAASFGRGFYVLDDLSALRKITEERLEEPAALYPIRKAWWYIPRPMLGFEGGKGDLGAAHYVAPNPPFGAVFPPTTCVTIYRPRRNRDRNARRKCSRTTARSSSPAGMRSRRSGGSWIPGSGSRSAIPRATSSVESRARRRKGSIVSPGICAIRGPTRYGSSTRRRRCGGGPPQGLMAAPGKYTVTLSSRLAGEVQELAGPESFEVVPLRRGALKGADPAAVAAFWREYEDAVRVQSAMQLSLANLLKRVDRMQLVLATSRAGAELEAKLHDVRGTILDVDETLNGNRARAETRRGEPSRHPAAPLRGQPGRGAFHLRPDTDDSRKPAHRAERDGGGSRTDRGRPAAGGGARSGADRRRGPVARGRRSGRGQIVSAARALIVGACLLLLPASDAVAQCRVNEPNPCSLTLHGPQGPSASESCSSEVWKEHVSLQQPDRFSDSDEDGWWGNGPRARSRTEEGLRLCRVPRLLRG